MWSFDKPDEAETIRQLNDAFDVILERTAEDYGRAVRSVHAKAHGVMKGELVIDDDSAGRAAQGVFATPGRHDALIPHFTNAGDILPDAISLPRGLRHQGAGRRPASVCPARTRTAQTS